MSKSGLDNRHRNKDEPAVLSNIGRLIQQSPIGIVSCPPTPDYATFQAFGGFRGFVP